jgi:hypothetical protein
MSCERSDVLRAVSSRCGAQERHRNPTPPRPRRRPATARKGRGSHRVRRRGRREPPAATRSISPSGSFASLLSGTRGGADEAWTEIYRVFSPPVLGYLRGLGAAEAEDRTSESSFRWSGIYTASSATGRPQGMGARDRPSPLHRRTAAYAPPAGRAPRRARRARAPGPDAEVEALALLGAGRVRDLMASLSPDQRAVLLLRIVVDLTGRSFRLLAGFTKFIPLHVRGLRWRAPWRSRLKMLVALMS